VQRDALRRYLRTWSPWYDPAKIELPDGVQALLDRYPDDPQLQRLRGRIDELRASAGAATADGPARER